MKTVLKRIGLGSLILVLLLVGLAAHEWYAKKPFFFRAFLDRSVVKMAFESPETLTSLGFLESFGVTGHNALLDDGSPEALDKVFTKVRELRETLLSYQDDDLDDNQRISKDIALYLADFALASEPYRYHNYPLNQLFGVQNGYPSFMQAQHQVNSVGDGENYLSRLQQVKTKFSQTLEGLKIRENKGIVPPKFVIERVLTEMNAFVRAPVSENILYSSFKTKLAETDIAAGEQERLLAGAETNIKEFVYPAYQLFIDYFTQLQTKAGTNDGYWALPDGDVAYEQLLKFFTTTNYSADEIHAKGLAEVSRIQSEIMTILADEGYDVEQGFSVAIEALAADPKFYYEDSDAGRAQILVDYQSILDEINAGLDGAFRIRPEAGMEVVRIPEFKEKTAPGAYYQQPAIDGSRPGRFYANLYDIKATPKYGMRTLAYHEGIPGHHFQIAVAMELEGVPLIRKMAPFTAYIEGWALYSERLAWELGFQKDPFDNIGRLQAELFRAVRLVVDTGIHHSRWTREQAIDYMKKNTGMSDHDVTAEIERYIVMPGQATAYKVGMMKILELREKAKLALGDKFDLRDFHDVVLKNGAVPLDILDKLVNRYIAEIQSKK
ncbi:DUF885 domain-containing protein [Shewanella putrefaciens]|uniref:DUF885 domain-containing protein n=1 Tax=Shewanella putrefaciens TaxID=24 RepID=A0ABX8XEW6_SHEPU|nr:DUF885 domain-containing protein [Shewanella putrefaciens]AVV83030.1 hypothetical protein SPWS13_1221 [Shewanella putrefaciens]MCT8942315.1 DUF885 domain-containing protein [Shewanella putrefaciens]QSE50642.1 DUF885 domain-containing protein [Shewanella putrefaciens]QYX74052.1 DUF885 domain-containing protein [Shewanella putrefaciens]GGN14064.1 hypothetical protein GCM10007984_10400 [Shewanella putrefaciens]